MLLGAASALASLALAALYRPPLSAWARWAARRRGVDGDALLSAIHAETRGLATARRIEATARQLGAARGDLCAQALSLGALRFPRNELAGRLLADELIGGLQRGVEGSDALGLRYQARREPGCSVELPGDEGERQGAAFSKFWKASAHQPKEGRRVKAVVLHTTEGTFASAVAWFRREGAKTSAHYVIRASDGLVVQMVDEREVAFHDACFNEETIGIEHEGETRDGRRWYTPAMYRASARLVRDIAERHGVPLDRAHVVGHDEAPDCSEHDDPGPGWDWGEYWGLVRADSGARGG